MFLIEHIRVGTTPDAWDQEFLATCPFGHEFVVSIDDYADAWFEPANVQCGICGQPAQSISPDDVLCECPICREAFGVPADEMHATTHRCYGGMDLDSYQSVGSSSYFRDLVGDVWESSEPAAIRRSRRPDYWNLLTHYTRAEAFVAILRSGRIEARPTGYFGSRRRPREVKALATAVCLTETPIEFDAEIRDRFGPFGFVFERSAVLAMGGGPAINVPGARLKRLVRSSRGSRGLVSGWRPEFLPFINMVGPGFDYLHEREWRVPRDIDVVEPPKPLLVLPDDFRQVLGRLGVSSRELASWLVRFGRARVLPSDTATPG